MRNNFGWLVLLAVLAVAGGVLVRGAEQTRIGLEREIESRLLAQLVEIEAVTNQYFWFAQPVKILMVGDVMLGRGVEKVMEKKGDYTYPWVRVEKKLAAADLTFGNLEGPISENGEDQGGLYSFRFKPLVVEGLKDAGFDLLSLANNHILDWGGEALADTVSYLEEAGVRTVGAGCTEKKARRAVVMEIKGNRIGWLAYTNLYPPGLVASGDRGGVAGFDLEKAAQEVDDLKRQEGVEVAIVSLHWGEEYEKEPRNWQREAARRLVEAGADVIVGHHPHVVQPVEKYKNGWIAYSLGNFVFDQSFSEETMEGMALEVEIKEGRISAVKELVVKINDEFQAEIVGDSS